MSEELADKGQQDKRNGRGIDEHEHRDGILDDGAQSNVGNGKRKHREEDRPGAVGNFAVRHLDKRFRAGRDKADGGLEAGRPAWLPAPLPSRPYDRHKLPDSLSGIRGRWR